MSAVEEKDYKHEFISILNEYSDLLGDFIQSSGDIVNEDTAQNIAKIFPHIQQIDSQISSELSTKFNKEIKLVLSKLNFKNDTFVHRDFHVSNLIINSKNMNHENTNLYFSDWHFNNAFTYQLYYYKTRRGWA